MIINKGPSNPPTFNIIPIIHAIYRVWCPVRNIYFNFVNLAIKIFQNIPSAIISAVTVPYSFNASETIASLLGTIP